MGLFKEVLIYLPYFEIMISIGLNVKNHIMLNASLCTFDYPVYTC